MCCHRDFVRVLISTLKVRSFFAGDTICRQGDINNSMYFIHRGKVEVLSMEQNLEVLVDVLYEKDCFGVVTEHKCIQYTVIEFNLKISGSRFIF